MGLARLGSGSDSVIEVTESAAFSAMSFGDFRSGLGAKRLEASITEIR